MESSRSRHRTDDCCLAAANSQQGSEESNKGGETLNTWIQDKAERVMEVLSELQTELENQGPEFLARFQPLVDDAQAHIASLKVDNREGRTVYHDKPCATPGDDNPVQVGNRVSYLRKGDLDWDGSWTVVLNRTTNQLVFSNVLGQGQRLVDDHDNAWLPIDYFDAIVTSHA